VEVVEGPPFDPEALSFPAINPTRVAVGEALQQIGSAPSPDAPAASAATVYAGPLYLGLDQASLDSAAGQLADSSIVIISALWGAIRPSDQIPYYRLHMCKRLPGLEALPRVWQKPLARVLPAQAGDSLIVDFRVAEWARAWPPTPADRTVVIRVTRERGGRGSATYHSKYTRGLVARSLVSSGLEPSDPEDLAGILAGQFEVDLIGSDRDHHPWTLSVVERHRNSPSS
jgi:cytoplasmic iron level regulating protein YaaA (DUF328/UPF0246 family)